MSREEGKALLESGTFSDFTINVEDKTFRVHRVMLISAFTFFKDLLDDDARRDFTFSNTKPLVVAQLLLFAYRGNTALDLNEIYEIWPNLEPLDHVSIEEHQRTVNENDRSMMDQLRAEFDPIVHQDLVTMVNTSIDLYKLAYSHNMQALKNHVRQYVLGKFTVSLRGDPQPEGWYPNFVLTEQETADALVSIYDNVTEDVLEHGPLRNLAMIECIRFASRLLPPDAPAKVVETTILSHPQMRHDWHLGLPKLQRRCSGRSLPRGDSPGAEGV